MMLCQPVSIELLYVHIILMLNMYMCMYNTGHLKKLDHVLLAYIFGNLV